MAITHTSRTGKTYYLHTGPKRGGGTQYFCSTQSTGALAKHLPQGFEIYESINGQVFLRRKRLQFIRPEEAACVQRRLEKRRGGNLYRVETRGNTLTIFESADISSAIRTMRAGFSSRTEAEFRERFAYYQPVMRFILVDKAERLFAPERYCFRGSVDDWIPIGPPGLLEKMAAKFLGHLGQESFFELF